MGLIATAFKAIGRFWPVVGSVVLLGSVVLAHNNFIKRVTDEAYESGKHFVQSLWDAERLAQAEAALEATTENMERQIRETTAVHTAQAARIAAAQDQKGLVDSLLRDRDRLRGDLATALNTLRHGCSLPASTSDAVPDPAAALRAVFADMERAGAEMAGHADAHAADSLMYQNAWPH